MIWIDGVSRRASLRSCDGVFSRKVFTCDETVPALSPARNINNLIVDIGPLPTIKKPQDGDPSSPTSNLKDPTSSPLSGGSITSKEQIKKIFFCFEPKGCLKEREDYSLYLFAPNHRFRAFCRWFVEQQWFDNVVLLFIGLNCITLAMERPNIPPDSYERVFLATANYVFTFVFVIEMFVKVNISTINI